MKFIKAMYGLAAGCALAGCTQGATSELPPIHLLQNMDFQQKFEAQEKSNFFKDGRAMRKPVPGTVPHNPKRGERHRDEGRDENTGRLVDALPPGMKLDDTLLARGKERYNIYCAPCHGESGKGNGIVMQRGAGLAVPPPDFNDPRLTAMPLGHFFNVITHGVGEPPNQNMLSYASQIPVDDRWAISAWVRALQVYPRMKGTGAK